MTFYCYDASQWAQWVRTSSDASFLSLGSPVQCYTVLCNEIYFKGGKLLRFCKKNLVGIWSLLCRHEYIHPNTPIPVDCFTVAFNSRQVSQSGSKRAWHRWQWWQIRWGTFSDCLFQLFSYEIVESNAVQYCLCCLCWRWFPMRTNSQELLLWKWFERKSLYEINWDNDIVFHKRWQQKWQQISIAIYNNSYKQQRNKIRVRALTLS